MIFGSFNVYIEAPDNTIGDRIVLDTARALAHYPECVPGSMRAYWHEISGLKLLGSIGAWSMMRSFLSHET